MMKMWMPGGGHHDFHNTAQLTSCSVVHSSTYSYSDAVSSQLPFPDDLTASFSVVTVDETDSWPGQKSRQKPDAEELCLICGDRASGYHYNALSCEGCKGFFRRSVTRNAQYVCKYGGSCEMDMWMRRKCQACRLLRCRTVGMREECLLSERQCVARNARRQETHKVKRRQHRLGVVSVQGRSVVSPPPATAGPSQSQSPPQCHSPLQLLNDDHRDLISLIVAYQDKYELPTEDDIRRVTEMNIVSSMIAVDEADAVYGHMVEMAILVTRLVVELAKHLPGFHMISKDDQIALLKGASSEVMVLRAARRYDPETDTIVFGDGNPFSPSAIQFGHFGLADFVNTMFEFCRGMASLGVDNAEYALLIAICIFSDRAGVSNSWSVEQVQDMYTETLIEYIQKRRVDSSRFLAKLLMKLVDLRSINALHTDCLYRLTIAKGSLPPLLCEYFDLPLPHT